MRWSIQNAATCLGGWILSALCLVGAGAAQAATYTADASALNATLYPWIDISSSGTGLTLGDDAVSAAISIGFTFQFGSGSYSSLRIMSNGQVQFGGTSTAFTHTTLPLDGSSSKPNIDAVMMPLWDDLKPGANQVRYLSQGTAPNRVFIVSWLATPYYISSGTAMTATFQVQIYEQGQFVYRYGAVNGSGGTHTNSNTTNPSGAAIGFELSNSDYVLYSRNSSTVASGTTIVWSQITSPTLELLFNERLWSGTASEVQDSSGNGYHGTAASLSATKPSTSGATPATGTSIGSCGYGVFNRSNKDYVALPSAWPNLGSTPFTVTAWIRSTDNTKAGQRILVDDENNSGGFGLSLGDPGTGKLRFISRGLASSTSLDTAAVINNNTWYFVAFGINPATKTKVVYVYDTAGTQLAAVSSSYTESSFGSDSGITTIGGESNSAGGSENTNSFGFAGNIDELRVYPSALTASELATVRSLTSTCAAQLIAEYRFEESAYAGTAGELKDTAGYTGGPYNGRAQGSPLPSASSTSPARSSSPGTCGYASLPGTATNGGAFLVTGLPVSTTAGAKTSVAFWMYWDGTTSVMPIGWDQHDLWLQGGFFGFNTNNSDVYGISSTGLANGWHHVVAVFTNGSVTGNKLYIDGALQTLTQRTGTPNTARALVASSLVLGGWTTSTAYRMTGRIDQVRIYNGELTGTEVTTLYSETATCPVVAPHHLEIQHASGTGLTCTPSTVTVKACQDSSCSTPYTSGVSGTLSATGGNVVWPATAAFTIAAGSSSTTVSLQATTTTASVLGVASSAPTASNAASCNFGSPGCTFTAADAGLLFDAPDMRAESSMPMTVTAVRKSDNAAVCTPAFASVSKAITFKCSYSNPASGTLPVRVGGSALNSGNSDSAACDAGGRAVTLAFDAAGTASTTVIYADAGRMTLTGSYTGSGSDAGLVMSGSDSFVSAPYDFSVTGISTSAIAAGTDFSATVTARNYAGNATPNFGRETAPEGATLGFVRTHPSGSAAVSGSFSGSLGGFSNGVATASNLRYSEVGQGNVSAVLASGSYLGSGQTLAGASEGGLVWCGNENDSCVLPTGATVTMYYQAWGTGRAKVVSGLSGTVACNSATFGDPYAGWGKGCQYAATSGVRGWATAAATFKPHHFDVASTPACGAFSYAGQPFAASVTARNASGATTLNYDGSANTSPNFAKATTLAEAAALGVGNLSANALTASAFVAGVGSASPVYSFTNKTTAAQSLLLRATDTDSVSSAGYTEPSMPLRSGRLRLSNAYGSASAALQIPVVAEYWSGNAWVLNSADSCTALAGASVALSNKRDASGATSTASTSAGALAIATGSGLITLAAPSPSGSSLSLDIALNLGSTTADQSCQANHPSTTGAAKAWLRAANGSCAATSDRDPAARASFGIFSPESRRTVHVREIF